MPVRRPSGQIIFLDIGHGFRSPAEAIHNSLAKVEIKTDLIDVFKYYNDPFLDNLVKNGWKMVLMKPFLFDMVFRMSDRPSIRLFERVMFLQLKKKIYSDLSRRKPDFIISLHPNTNHLYADICSRLNIAMFAYNSDVIFSHHSYICNSVDKYFISSKQGYDAMLKHGQTKLELTGFPIANKYKKKFRSMKYERQKLNLKNKFTLLLMLGSDAVGVDETLVTSLVKLDIQVVVLCGKNIEILEKLKAVNSDDIHVRGFVDNMQDYLYCCDIVAGKSGLNFVFESIFMKKPFIVIKAMANERYAAKLIVDKKIGWYPKSNKETIDIVQRCSNDARILKKIRDNIKRLNYDFDTDKIGKSICKHIIMKKILDLRDKKHLLFDLGDTLCDISIDQNNWHNINYKSMISVLKFLKVESNKQSILATKFVKIKEKNRILAKKTLKEYDIKWQLKRFLENEKIKYDGSLENLERIFVQDEYDICHPFPKIKPLLKKLNKRYHLCIISNNASAHLVNQVLEKCKIKNYFNKIFVSTDIGFRKPHKKYVDHVLNNLKISSQEAVVIGDRLNQDIKMGFESNISTIFINIKSHEDNKEVDDIYYDFEAKNLMELERLLIK